MSALNLYLHFPFCKAKCRYCDFFSLTGKEILFADYLKALKAEWQHNQELWLGKTIHSVYLGGGTPSLLPANQVADVLLLIKEQAQLSGDVEISIEANPESLTKEKLLAYKEVGINRISLGLQAWQNRLLTQMGRIHTVETFIKCFEVARSVGFSNINVDLIFGLPNQTMADWQETLLEVVKLKPTHISAYSLELDNHSFWGQQVKLNKMVPTTDSLDRQMYHYTQDFLEMNGYQQYELSNYAQKGFECQHNLRFWQGEDYLGLGASAWSRIGQERWQNIDQLDDYIEKNSHQNSSRINQEIISDEQLNQERLLLSLRLTKGVDLSEFDQKWQTQYEQKLNKQIQKLAAQGLVLFEHHLLSLTKVGQDVERQVGATLLNGLD